MKGKKLLAGLLSATMVFGTLPFAAFADGETVNASENETSTVVEVKSADDLIKAIEDATAATIVKFDADIELGSSLVIGGDKEITLNLNGKTLSVIDDQYRSDNGEYYYYNTVKNSGKLTVTGEGTIEGANNAISSYSGATLAIENGTFIGNHSNGLWNGGTLTIKDGKFQGKEYEGVYNCGDLKIETGDFDGNNTGVWNDGTATISGGDFYGITYGVCNVGTATISGGTFTGTDWGAYNTGTLKIENGTFTTEAEGSKYAVLSETDGSTGAELTIKDGKFDGTVVNLGKKLEIFDGNFSSVSNATVISGGTFDKVIYNDNNNNKVADATITGGVFNLGEKSWTDNFFKVLANAETDLTKAKFTKNAVDSFGKTLYKSTKGYLFADVADENGYYAISNVGVAKLTIETPANGEIKALDGGVMKFLENYVLPNSIEVTKGSTLTKDADFQNVTAVPGEDYDFNGWYLKIGDASQLITKNAELDSFIMPTEDATLYAVIEESEEKKALNAAYAAWIADYANKTEFTVSNPVEMACLAKAVNEDGKDFSGKTVSLKSDLDYTGIRYTPVGNKSKAFNGTFDGENHTISNITSEMRYTYEGIFGYTKGTVKNLNVKDSSFIADYAGGIAAEALGTIENCSADGIKLNGSLYAGGIAGHSYAMTIRNITVKNISGRGWKSGAVIGYSDDLTLEKANVVVGGDSECEIVASLVGHINAGTHKISDVTVTVPEGKKVLPAFGTAYSDSKKTITLSGDNDITASNLIKNLEGGNLYITGGHYTIDSIADALSNSENLKVSGGTFSTDVSDYVEDGLKVRFVNGRYVVGKDDSADTIALTFVQHKDEVNVYDIVLSGDNKNINRLNAAEFTFALDVTKGDLTYEIAAADKMSLITKANAENYYEFHFDGKDDFDKSEADIGKDITIGTVTFDGYGEFKFYAESGRATATTTADNLVTEFVTTNETGKGTLKIDEDANKIDGKITVPTQTLTINVAMNHKVNDNVAAYQDMTVEISGGDLGADTKVFKLGTNGTKLVDGVYKIEQALTQNRLYTVTVKGAGYRTARYTVNMSADKKMNFWNNVMTSDVTVVDDMSAKKNFLAGDIVKDGVINIYDLSAVVAYFGADKLQTSNQTYAKYDINRDGKIDMMDISIVLTSWGE